MLVELSQGTPEWHEWRKGGIGASDVAALFDKSPYKTKRDLWFEKSGFGEPDDEDRSYIYARGHEVENEIRELFFKQTKIELKPVCFEREVIFRASLDGYDKSHGVLEAKFVGKEVLKKAEGGEIPEHHRIQIQAQLYTSQADKAYWAGMAPKIKGGVVVEVGRDEKLIQSIETAVIEFWGSLADGTPPELSPKDTLFITDLNHVALFNQLCALKQKKEAIESEYEHIEEIIKRIATHTKVKCGNVTVSEVERAGSVDYKSIPEVKQLAQDYIEQFRKKASIYKKINFGKEA